MYKVRNDILTISSKKLYIINRVIYVVLKLVTYLLF